MRKGNMTTLASIFIVASIMFSVGLGTMAYFSSEAESLGNTFISGTFLIELDPANPATFFTVEPPVNWAPGETYTASLTITNIGSLDMGWIRIKPQIVAGAGFAHKIEITRLYLEKQGYKLDNGNKVYDGPYIMHNMIDWMESSDKWADVDSGAFTLYEFASGSLSENTWFNTGPEDGIMENGHTLFVEFDFYFDEEANNNYQDKTCTFNLLVQALQAPTDYPIVGYSSPN